MLESLKHVQYKLLYLNLVLTTKEKLLHSHRESRWQGFDIQDGEPVLEIHLSERLLGWHQAWMTSVRSQEGKVNSWAWPQLHGSHRIKIIPIFWEGLMNMVASPAHTGVPCDTRAKSPLLIICHQTISWEESKSHERFFKVLLFNSLNSSFP